MMRCSNANNSNNYDNNNSNRSCPQPSLFEQRTCHDSLLAVHKSGLGQQVLTPLLQVQFRSIQCRLEFQGILTLA